MFEIVRVWESSSEPATSRWSQRPAPETRPAYVMAISLFVLSCLLLAGAAAAVPRVYHSPADDGVGDPSPPYLPSGGSLTLHLYMDETGGSAVPSLPAEVCHTGSGDERCGWDLAIEPEGDLTFTSFTPTGDVVWGLTATRLRFNGGAFDTGELGPVKLGDLVVASTGDGQVQLTQGTVVDAALLRQSLVSGPIVFVPEPAMGLALVAGAGLLHGLLRSQRRRARRSETSVGERQRPRGRR